MELNDGLNVIYEENGWGKSTLAVFLKAMLYGLPATSKRSLDENERKKYTPWQGGSYGGSLEFECARGTFRVERTFAAKESGDTFDLYDLLTNKPSQAFSKALGEELFGIDADGFERSTYLSQRSCAEKCDSGSISARLTGLLSDVDDVNTYDGAIALLEKRRKFYTLTGNRGAIAELEQAIRELDVELEHCRTVEQGAEQKRTELQALQAQIVALESTVAQTRSQLKQASELRERAAHLEHQKKAQAEILDLRRRKNDIEKRFGDSVPTEEECKAARTLYERIKDAHAKRNAIPASCAEADDPTQIKKRFPYGFPSSDALEKLQAENQRLRDLRARKDALDQHRGSDPLDVRFANGVPSSEQINRAFEALRHAENAEKEFFRCKQEEETLAKKQKNRLALPSILLLLLGLALPCASFVPTLNTAFGYLVAAGVATVLIGIILLAVGASRKRAVRKQVKRLARTATTYEADRAQHLRDIRAFLAQYGMDGSAELSRALTELNVSATAYRASARQRRRFEEESAQIQKQIGELCAALQMSLSRYLPNTAQKSDYQQDLDLLNRESERFARLELQEQKRAAAYAQAEKICAELQNELLPFLRRYDREGKLRAGECLNAMLDACAEHRRLAREVAQKEADLRAFTAEKQLDTAMEGALGDYDALMRENNAQQERLNVLMEQQGLQKTALERLLNEVDRIPELEAERLRKTEQLKQYVDNSNTIAATAKFLEEAKTALSTRYLTEMQSSFSHILTLLTEDSDKEAALDTSFEVRLRQGGKTHTMESFSRGWQDLVRFCLHLSLSEALFPEGEKPFLLLDDPFVNLDDRRLDAARKLLDVLAQERQIVYMVCHKERA